MLRKAAHQVPCAPSWPVIGKGSLSGRVEEFQNLFVRVQSLREPHGGRFGKVFRGGHLLCPMRSISTTKLVLPRKMRGLTPGKLECPP
jgi:hypothetical protein